MPENSSNTATQEVADYMRLHPDHEVHLLSDLGKTKMMYAMTREDHEAEIKALRFLEKSRKASEKTEKNLRAAQFDSGVWKEVMGIEASK